MTFTIHPLIFVFSLIGLFILMAPVMAVAIRIMIRVLATVQIMKARYWRQRKSCKYNLSDFSSIFRLTGETNHIIWIGGLSWKYTFKITKKENI